MIVYVEFRWMSIYKTVETCDEKWEFRHKRTDFQGIEFMGENLIAEMLRKFKFPWTLIADSTFEILRV